MLIKLPNRKQTVKTIATVAIALGTVMMSSTVGASAINMTTNTVMNNQQPTIDEFGQVDTTDPSTPTTPGSGGGTCTINCGWW